MRLGVALQQEDLGSLAQLDRSRTGSAKRQQQQQRMDAVESVLEPQQQQQQQQALSDSRAQQQQQQIRATQQAQQQTDQQPQQSGGSIADARILQLLSIVKEQQQQRSVSQPGQGWGYYGSAAAAAPCLQRAQWLAEEISRVQHSRSQIDSSSTTSSSSAVVDSSSSSGNSTAIEQQQGAEASNVEVLLVLYRQLQRQLITHLSTEVSGWQDVARVYEVFGEHLNPGIVCWCLTALQRVYRRGLVPPGQQKQAAMRLLQQLLRLVWHWQQRLAPRVSCWIVLLITRQRYSKSWCIHICCLVVMI
jgi:hypothetical protein